ncbi:MAG: SRPBCC family protein [Burkholderiales bacterium]|uniref:SRPBCC family protein n=1 Tax=Inhella sp. TaxID=1921806 RepID=UPI001AD25EBE|nr:SRPBCC family protein [Burkholderiales bacterium]
MKRALKITAALAVLLVAVVLVGGLLLKPSYRVERSLLIQAPADRVYAHLDSSAGWQRWGVWYRRDPDMRVQNSGSAQGLGASWQWSSASQGNGRMRITAADAGRLVGYELAIDDFPPSQGELRLEAEGQGTRVIWLMQGETGASPIGRWFGLFMDQLVGPDFEGGLANLKQLAEKG